MNRNKRLCVRRKWRREKKEGGEDIKGKVNSKKSKRKGRRKKGD